MAVTADSKKRMLKVYERFNRIRASLNNSHSSNAELEYGTPYAVGTNAAVAVTDEVILTNTPYNQNGDPLNKVTIYDTRNYAKPGDFNLDIATFTTYTSMEEILEATPATGAYIYLGAKGTTANRNRHGVGIGTFSSIVGSQLWNNSLNAGQVDRITAGAGGTSTRSGYYSELTSWQSTGPWDDLANFMGIFRVDQDGGTDYLVICPSVVFQGATSSATSGLRVVYDVSDKGLTYSQPGRLIIEEVVSNLVEE